MRGLLLVERMVLESVSRCENTINGISKDTTLSLGLVKNIISYFESKDYLESNDGVFKINESKTSEWKDGINDEGNIKEEVKELFTSLVNGYFAKEKKSKLNIQKFYLNKDEEGIFNALVSNVESFIENIKKDRSRTKIGSTGEHKVFMWGSGKYQDIARAAFL